ncbi:MAG: hypothetical protein ABR571_08500 [Jatrophihabitans sp.]|uniref:hypothetical protein n=1 Tax=Jatrophihabitans sp. TaxID=1932789 RepID=UPI0039102194
MAEDIVSEAADSPAEPTYIDYAEFGRRFFSAAVTRDRVLDGVRTMTGRPIEVGPLSVGPMGLAKVRARGTIGEPTLEPRDAEEITFALTIPVDLKLTIQTGIDTYRFAADVRVNLVLTARAAEPLVIVIDVPPPSSRDIDVGVQAEGLRATFVQTLASVDAEIKRAVAKFVRRELAKPALQKATRIDVARALERYATPR